MFTAPSFIVWNMLLLLCVMIYVLRKLSAVVSRCMELVLKPAHRPLFSKRLLEASRWHRRPEGSVSWAGHWLKVTWITEFNTSDQPPCLCCCRFQTEKSEISWNSWISYFLCCQQKLLVNLIKLVLHTARVLIDCLNKNARKHRFSYSSLTRSNLKSFTECQSQVCKDVSMLLWCCNERHIQFSPFKSSITTCEPTNIQSELVTFTSREILDSKQKQAAHHKAPRSSWFLWSDVL